MGSPHPSPSPPSPMQNPPGAVLSQGGPPLWALPRDRGQMPLLMIGKPRELGSGPKPSLEWLAPNLTGPFAWATPVHVEGGGALSGRGASLGPTTLKPFSHQLPAQWHLSQRLTPYHTPARPPPEPTPAHACFLPSASSILTCAWNSGCFCTPSWPSLLSAVPGSPRFVPVTWCGFPVGTARDPLQAHTAWACQGLPITLCVAEPSVSTFLSSSLISQMVLCLLAR